MGIEIERKFLVHSDGWKQQAQRTLLRQGYLSSHPDRVVRVRIDGETAMLTIKGRASGASRSEWEYSIPMTDAETMLDRLCEQPLIEKWRYRVDHDGMLWEVDEFLGQNLGLVVAEIELMSEDQPFARPGWLGEEVTHDPRYANASLVSRPFCQW